MRLPSLALILLATMPASAGMPPPEPVSGPIRVIDGDTVALSSGERVRIYNIDAPETHEPRCAAEASAGAAATALVTAWLAEKPVMISRCEPTIAASRIDRLARAGLVSISTFVANGTTVTAARLTDDGEGARR